MQQQDKRLIIATALSMIILLSWTWFYERPKLEKTRMADSANQQKESKTNAVGKILSPESPQVSKTTSSGGKIVAPAANSHEEIGIKKRQQIIDETKNNRVSINSNMLHGSLLLTGARFDDLTLANYFKDQSQKEEVVLFSPAGSKDRYFVDFGWVSSDAAIDLPKPETLWKVVGGNFSAKTPLILRWESDQKVEFRIKISLDEGYLFNVEQEVSNNSNREITIATYGRVEKAMENEHKSNYILHEGAIGVFDGILQEANYEELAKKIHSKNFSDAGDKGAWLGITDKYWLSSLIPDHKMAFDANVSHETKERLNLYKVNFVGEEVKVATGGKLKSEHHLFAGAKKVRLLDDYGKKLNLKLFDRAVDFGWFYFLTRPFFFVIDFLSKISGNFGVAILLMTVLVKLALFPLANKSYIAIARLKSLQPKIETIRARFKDDKVALNREVMELYKREKINPASGCLPVLIQIPVFFALYKVLFVTLDMRHAAFFGWIKDLSAPDPTSIFNLFGLLPFNVGAPFLIGVWPILMGLTMILQQHFNPPASDPTQAKIMKFMPYVLTCVLASFPAGLVIYWTWSNVLSIAQQAFIAKTHDKNHGKSLKK